MDMKFKKNERGSVLIITFVILLATLVLTFTAMIIGTTETRLAGNYRDSISSFFASEGGIQASLRELRANPTWSEGFLDIALTNGATYDVTVETISPVERRVLSTGYFRNSTRSIEVTVNVDSAFAYAINVGGDLSIYASPMQADQGVRANGQILLELGAHHPDIHVYNPDPENNITVVGHNQHILAHEAPILDMDSIRLTQSQWQQLASAAFDEYYFDDDGTFGNKDTHLIIHNFACNVIPPDEKDQRTLYVDGNITLTGQMQNGTNCTLIASGDITATGATPDQQYEIRKNVGISVSFLAKEDVVLNLSTNKISEFTGLIYAEGDFEVAGKMEFNGVISVMGNALIGKTADWVTGNPRKFWQEYTQVPLFDLLTDPIDIIQWQEKHPDIG
jgi:Tfp pilus assembly protein PilX